MPPARSIENAGNEGAFLFPCAGAVPRFVEVALPTADETLRQEIEHRWAELKRSNPRLFDGPIWSVLEFESETCTFTCCRDSYKSLAVRPNVNTSAALLAVTGVLFDERCERLLLAKRSMQVHGYPGLWEFAPAGGVEAHPDHPCPDLDMLHSQLRQECAEEFGLDGGAAALQPNGVVAVVRDELAHSFDIVVRCVTSRELESKINLSPAGWEYEQRRWVDRDEARAWLRSAPGSLIPPTRLLLKHFGWA